VTPITEEWLKSSGFRWDEWERSGGKHWTLWFGDIQKQSFSSFEDLGIEVCRNRPDSAEWSCWLRSDCSHKYARFIHLRYVTEQRELITLVEALTGLAWQPENHLYGSIRTPSAAAHIRETEDRLDRRVMKQSKWAKHESDKSAARPTRHDL
jgi:hypothetical protein